ncbi:MAG: MBL fold metallo-hydrolase [Firmicutes bacterium HGW-Firmicutes-14]|nr:MAG: MBL fold metallo-hydrolase [Firmicutes bacterium HGW-Firmicutes-14]
MIIECIPVGMMGANCYCIGCRSTREAAVIDPGGDVEKILNYLKENDLNLKYIINTHGHIDHVAGNDKLREQTGAKLLIHELDAPMLSDTRLNLSSFMGFEKIFKNPDRLLTDEDTIEIGDIRMEVMHTPGHTRGGICLSTEGAVFTGDTLFNGSIGRTDFPGGDFDTIINSIKLKLLSLPDDTAVYPGHMGHSTIAYERKYNPFLR